MLSRERGPWYRIEPTYRGVRVPREHQLATLYFEQAGLASSDRVVLARVDRALASAIDEARTRCPGCKVDLESFVKHLAGHMGDHVLAEGWTSEFRVDDLLLAFASGTGCDGAAKILRDRSHSVIDAAARRFDGSSSFADEVRQKLFEKLLVASPNRGPRILAYAGRGAIEAWVRVAAVRAAIDLVRQRRGGDDASDDRLLDELDASGGDPELAYIRLRYADDVHAAFRAAFGVLTARERTVLRLHLLDGLNIDRIGVIYHVHRATVARWIARARETISVESHRLLQERLGATDSEVESLERLVRSDLQVCLSELLATAENKESGTGS